MEKNINFLAWLYTMSKGSRGRRPRALHAKECRGGCGNGIPAQHWGSIPKIPMTLLAKDHPILGQAPTQYWA